MLNITFAKAKKSKACIESYRKLGNALGGITKYGKDTPIPLDKVLEVCGLQDAIWALRCTIEPSKNFIIELSCRYFEHVEYLWDAKYPGDKRPRQAILAARTCLTDKSQAAGDAARVAGDAARAAGAAWDAGAAEIEWQSRTLLELLNGG